MTMESFYPVLMTKDPEGLADFYSRHFGFEVTFTSDWYVSLKAGEANFELAFLSQGHESIPKGYASPSAGVILNVETDDATSWWNRLAIREKLPVRLELRDEAWGQRHFIVSDPAGNLVDIIENIEPSKEYKEAYGA